MIRKGGGWEETEWIGERNNWDSSCVDWIRQDGGGV